LSSPSEAGAVVEVAADCDVVATVPDNVRRVAAPAAGGRRRGHEAERRRMPQLHQTVVVSGAPLEPRGLAQGRGLVGALPT